MAAESTTHSGEKHPFSFYELVKKKKLGGKQIAWRLTLSGGIEGTGKATVVVKTAVVVNGAVMTLVNVMGAVITLVYGGFCPPGASGALLSLCWEPMNRPTKIEQSRRKTRRRISKILLSGVSGS